MARGPANSNPSPLVSEEYGLPLPLPNVTKFEPEALCPLLEDPLSAAIQKNRIYEVKTRNGVCGHLRASRWSAPKRCKTSSKRRFSSASLRTSVFRLIFGARARCTDDTRPTVPYWCYLTYLWCTFVSCPSVTYANLSIRKKLRFAYETEL